MDVKDLDKTNVIDLKRHHSTAFYRNVSKLYHSGQYFLPQSTTFKNYKYDKGNKDWAKVNKNPLSINVK